MITFSIAIVLLILGYLVYGAIVEKIFGTDKDRKTPCYTCADGVDYIPMKTWKVYLIQFLNIAGTGPIFGAIQGILFGPAAYLWIVFGCIFGGIRCYSFTITFTVVSTLRMVLSTRNRLFSS